LLEGALGALEMESSEAPIRLLKRDLEVRGQAFRLAERGSEVIRQAPDPIPGSGLLDREDRGDDGYGNNRSRRQADRCDQPGDALAPEPVARPRSCAPGNDRLPSEIPTEVVRQRLGRAVAPSRVLLQALEANHFQVARGPRIEARGERRGMLAHLLDRLQD